MTIIVNVCHPYSSVTFQNSTCKKNRVNVSGWRYVNVSGIFYMFQISGTCSFFQNVQCLEQIYWSARKIVAQFNWMQIRLKLLSHGNGGSNFKCTTITWCLTEMTKYMIYMLQIFCNTMCKKIGSRHNHHEHHNQP